MKPQDILFIVIFIILLFFRKPKVILSVGILCLLLAMPLFAKWIFFTAERLTWYGAGFFFLAILVIILKLRHNEK